MLKMNFVVAINNIGPVHGGYHDKHYASCLLVIHVQFYTRLHVGSVGIQWSLRFKTPVFNNSLHFKTGFQ